MALTNDQIDAQNFKDFYDRISGMIPNGEHRLTSDELEEIDLENKFSVVPTTSNLKFSVGVENKIGSCAVNAQGDYKPFYEQVISGTTPSRVSGECATGLSGIENVQLCSVYVVADDFTKNLLSATAISNDGATIAFELPMDSIYFGKEFYATVRYTKTNDAIAGRLEEKKASIVFADSLTINAGSQANVLVMTNDDSPLITKSSDTSLVTISNVKDGNSYTSTIKVADSDSGEPQNITTTFKIGSYNKNVNIIIPASIIYGVQWDGSSSASLTRTDKAVGFANPNPYYSGNSNPTSPFDNISPWKDLRIVEDANAGTLVEIPKFYYKWIRSDSTMKLQVSMFEFSGCHVSPAHADRGDGVGERDYVYIGRYHCATDNYKSHGGKTPKVSLKRSDFRTNVHALGTYVWMMDFAMMWTVNMLYLVEFAHWDSQLKIGYGRGNGQLGNMGYDDSLPYHTGTRLNSRTTYAHCTQYRYIEGWWDNVRDFIDGIYISGTSVYAINNPTKFSDNANGVLVGTCANATGYITGWTNPTVSGYEYALFPSTTSTSPTGTTYICDYFNKSSGATVIRGGNYSKNFYGGAFHLSNEIGVNNTDASTGTRLMVLPPSRLT